MFDTLKPKAINGLILSTEEWAVALEITSMVGLDVGNSDVEARNFIGIHRGVRG